VATEKDISQLIRELRARLSLTQEKFAAKLGVTFSTINRWENARACPSPLALQRLENLARELGDEQLVKRCFGTKQQVLSAPV